MSETKTMRGGKSGGAVNTQGARSVIMWVITVVVAIAGILYGIYVLRGDITSPSDTPLKGNTANNAVGSQATGQESAPIAYPTASNKTLVKISVDGYRIPFIIPTGMHLLVNTWNNEVLELWDVTWDKPIIVGPGYVETDKNPRDVILVSNIGRDMYVEYWLEPIR